MDKTLVERLDNKAPDFVRGWIADVKRCLEDVSTEMRARGRDDFRFQALINRMPDSVLREAAAALRATGEGECWQHRPGAACPTPQSCRENGCSAAEREQYAATTGEGEMTASLVREAAEILRTVGMMGVELPANWRWPLIDELFGTAAIMEATTPAEPLRDAGAVAWLHPETGDLASNDLREWYATNYPVKDTDRFKGYIPLYAHPAPQRVVKESVT